MASLNLIDSLLVVTAAFAPVAFFFLPLTPIVPRIIVTVAVVWAVVCVAIILRSPL